MTQFKVRASACAAAAMLLAATGSASAGYLGREFPDFTANDPLTGRTYSLSDFRGKVVVVDFWASWCGPCRREMPSLLEVRDTYKDRGVEIVGISLDYDMDRFRQFVAEKGMDWVHVMEGGGWQTRLVQQYGIRSIPTMYVIDAAGVCVGERVRGASLLQAVERAVAAAEAAGEQVSSPVAEGDGSSYTGLARQLGRARVELEPVLGPLDTFNRRLERLAGVADRLGPLVEAPEGAAAARERLARLREDVQDVRHALFMAGVIGDERMIDMAAPSGGDLAAELRAVRLAIEWMNDACADVAGRVREVARQIGELQEEVSRRAAAASVLQDRIGAVQEDAITLAGQWCDPWLAQLDDAEEIIEAARMRSGGACGDVDQLAAEAAGIRREVELRLARGADLSALKDRFSELARQVLACRDSIGGG